MFVKERNISSIIDGYREKLSDPLGLPSSVKRIIARKPYHLDNGTNLMAGLPKPAERKEGKI